MVEDLDKSERESARIRAHYGENIEGLSRDLETCRKENRQLKERLDELEKNRS